MLSTRRLLRASKLLCDLKFIEGTNKCRFHVYAVNGAVRQRQETVRRKQTPLAFGVVNFASSDASAAAGSTATQVLPYSDADLKTMEAVAPQHDVLPPSLELVDDPEILPAFESPVETSTSVSLDSDGVKSPEFEEPLAFDTTSSETSTSVSFDLDGVKSSELEEPLPLDVTSSEALGTAEPGIPELEDATTTHPQEVLAVDSAPFEEPPFFESSLIPEVRASPLDGSFDAIPDVVPTIPSDATSILGQVKDLVPPDVAATVAENVGKFASEPSFSSIGLGGWGPVGMVQYTLEFFHVSLGLPWWGSIALGTLILRTLVFPLVIMAQRNAAKMNNHLPEMQAIQLKMSDARERGDKLDAARYAQELMEFMKVKGLNPLKNMVVPLAQAPFFISMFMGIRGMANLPVESFRTGGLWWFTDLTIADQYYLLPLITSATLALTVEVGTDMARLSSSNMGMAKYFLRAMPVIIFPFTVNFPAGVLVYWCSTNFISLAQVAILRIPAVRDFFKIERLVKHDKKQLPMKDKGFVGGIKDSWTNMKITRELEERERLDNANFLRAGRGAIKKTYKFDPTQPRPPRNLSSIQAKKRD